MKILAFEYMSGGGFAESHPLDEHLQPFLDQGKSMLQAVGNDLLELGHELLVPLDVEVELTLESKLNSFPVAKKEELEPTLRKLAEQADAILLIAPEDELCLTNIAQVLAPWADRFISPDLAFIQLAGNKWSCHQWLMERGVPCPETHLCKKKGSLPHFFDLKLPFVVKPVSGAGSDGVELIRDHEQFLNRSDFPLLIQEWIAGTAVSIAYIRNANDDVYICEPGRQILDGSPLGRYQRTEYPLREDERQRAFDLARKVIQAMPKTCGYVGLDLVLGEDELADRLIEINPRLTSSYYHWKSYSGLNLARYMF